MHKNNYNCRHNQKTNITLNSRKIDKVNYFFHKKIYYWYIGDFLNENLFT